MRQFLYLVESYARLKNAAVLQKEYYTYCFIKIAAIKHNAVEN